MTSVSSPEVIPFDVSAAAADEFVSAGESHRDCNWEIQAARLEAATRTATGSDQILEKLAARRVRPCDRPAEPEVRISLAGKPVCTPGNITSLIARSKVGKTSAEGAAVAAVIAAMVGRTDVDTFKFSASNPRGRAVLIFDTEQSEFDAYTCLRRILARAGEEGAEDIEWLYVYSMAGMQAAEVRAAIPVALETCARAHGGIHSVFVDGVADIVCDPNDQKECNPVVAELHNLAIRFDCPIVCVIHANESKASGDDGRGHLGKQLIRKSESNLVLSKDADGVTSITSEKMRRAPITAADGVAFAWSDDLKRHVTVTDGSKACRKADEKAAALRMRAEESFDKDHSLKFSVIVERWVKNFGCSSATAERQIGQAVAAGILKKSFGSYTLTQGE